MRRRLALLAAGCLLAACVPGERTAQRVTLETEIRFVDAAGQPLANETAYLIETLPFEHYVTQVFRTDTDGGVRLSGIYCTPVIVAVDGGEILLRNGSVPAHTVIVSADHQPRVLAMYAGPVAGYTTLRRSASYADCKPPPGPL